uniref:ORC1/DEAH AAA+ ATPase domain-containing protein n=1 Tax=Bionectria ochroleuca TaxID=29856 RepID=A0A8H7K6B6_BIOOC
MVKFGPQDHEYANVRERLRGLARRALTVHDRILVKIPYNQNLDFVGRSSILHTLKQQLGFGQPRGSAEPRTRVALYGLSGIGKTQIVLAYIYWLQKQRPDIAIFWVHASNAERFHQAYDSIAKECNIPGYDDPKADLLSLVQEWLEKKYKTQWLMVIDNADNIELFFQDPLEEGPLKTTTAETRTDYGLSGYIPECRHASVIVTTRNKKTGSRLAQGKLPIEVGNMNDNEAHLLLHAILEDEEISADETSLLSSRLEHLPLALVQAAAFIQENAIPLSEYIQLLDDSDAAFVDHLSEPFETVGRDSRTPHAVTATWIISFNQIQRRNPFESDILSFISFFHCRRFQGNLSRITAAADSPKMQILLNQQHL